MAAEEFEIELRPSEQARLAIDPQVPEIYFCDDLLGYGWCIRKGALLNVGLGRVGGGHLPEHVRGFCQFLKQQGRIAGERPAKFQGHAYQLYDQSTRPLLADGVLWIGDAAGLAATQSGEGIGPAIESGLLAASVIASGRRRLSSGAVGAVSPSDRGPFRTTAAASGRHRRSALRRLLAWRLLAGRWFVRRVVLDRWFLHAGQAALEQD